MKPNNKPIKKCEHCFCGDKTMCCKCLVSAKPAEETYCKTCLEKGHEDKDHFSYQPADSGDVENRFRKEYAELGLKSPKGSMKNLGRELIIDFWRKELSRTQAEAYKEGLHKGYEEEGNKCYEHCKQAQMEARRELVEELQNELQNGSLRESFEEHFAKDNIDENGDYLYRPSTTNRSGALVYLGDITTYLRKIIKEKQ